MSHTLGSVVAQIRGDINRGTDFDIRIHQAIVNAIEFYKARRYNFNTRRTEITVTGEYYSFSVDLITVDYLTLLGNNYRKPLIKRTAGFINEDRTDRSFSAEPVFYAMQTNALRFDCPPDRTYSMSIFYHFHLTGISLSTSDSTTTNAWLSDAYELIKSHAEAEVREVYIGGDEEIKMAAVLKARARDFEPELKRFTNKQQKSGRVRPVL